MSSARDFGVVGFEAKPHLPLFAGLATVSI